MTDFFQRFSYKIIRCGDEIEVYRYDISRFKNPVEEKEESEEEIEKIEKEKKEPQEEISDPDYKRNSANVKKVKQKIRRLINANAFQSTEKDKFLTLTVRGEESPTRQEISRMFRNFRDRLKRRYSNFMYIAVIERGTHGTERLHIHALFFNLPFIPHEELMEIWEYGGVNVQAVDTFFDLANYITKYIEKTLEDGSTIPKGKKFYYTSRGLLKPEEYLLSEEEAQAYLDTALEGKELVYDVDFESEHVGKGTYTKYARPRVIDTTPRFENEVDLMFYLDSMGYND